MKSNIPFAILCFVTLILAGSPVAVLHADDDGFESLFDGKSLKGWEGKDEFWSVEDGAIVGQTTSDNPTKGNTFLVYKGGEPENFHLKLKFRIHNHNSGIQYRSKLVGDFVVAGYQADIEGGTTWIGILYEEKGRGVLAKRTEKVTVDADGKKQVTGSTGKNQEILDAIDLKGWNEYEIIADGNHLVQKINGKTTIELIDNQEDKRSMKGILALQLHAGPPMKVEFKEIRLKTLK